MSNLVITLVTGAWTPLCGLVVRSGQVVRSHIGIHNAHYTMYGILSIVQYSALHYITVHYCTVQCAIPYKHQMSPSHQTPELDTKQCQSQIHFAGEQTLLIVLLSHTLWDSQSLLFHKVWESNRNFARYVWLGMCGQLCSGECILIRLPTS